MIALLGAMKEETGAIEGRMAVGRRTGGKGFDLLEGEYRGKEVLLLRTGIGRKGVEKALGQALSSYPLDAIISLGFAGGLVDGIEGGDVVICQGVCCGDAALNGGGGFLLSDPRLVSLARELALKQGIKTHLGGGVTVSRAACSPGEKRRLGVSFAALMVEMEGYWTARMAAGKGVPFLNLRAISDPVEDPLPPLGHLMDLSTGSWSRGKALVHFATHPRQVAPVFKVFLSFRRGRQNLVALLGAVVENL